MMLSAHELARIFFAGESDVAHIVTADAFDKCEHLVPHRLPSACSTAFTVDTRSSLRRLLAMRAPMIARRSWSLSIPIRTLW